VRETSGFVLLFLLCSDNVCFTVKCEQCLWKESIVDRPTSTSCLSPARSDVAHDGDLNNSNRERRRRIAQQPPRTEQTCIGTGCDQPGCNCESLSTTSSCDALSLINVQREPYISTVALTQGWPETHPYMSAGTTKPTRNPSQYSGIPGKSYGIPFPHRGICHGDSYLTVLNRSFANQRCERCGTV
jgi:hypothetical protein